MMIPIWSHIGVWISDMPFATSRARLRHEFTLDQLTAWCRPAPAGFSTAYSQPSGTPRGLDPEARSQGDTSWGSLVYSGPLIKGKVWKSL